MRMAAKLSAKRDARVVVDFGDEFFELALGVEDVGERGGDGRLAFFKLRLLADGVEVDVAEAGDFAFEFVDFRGDGIPVRRGFLRGCTCGVSLVKVDLQFVHRVFDQRFDANR